MKLYASFLLVLCLIGFSFPAGFAESSAGYQQVYIAMLEEFERGNYADAYIAATIVYEANPAYPEIVNYYNYLTALQEYLPEGKYKEAYDVFQALALRQFQKSEGYAAYALGCQYVRDDHYEAALEQFKAAFINGIDAAYQKIQDCQKTIIKNTYDRALELQHQKEYLAAAEIFDSLTNDYPDAQDKAKACRYSAAEALSLKGSFKEAADLFSSLGDYQDSAQKAIENRAWASEGNTATALGLKLESAASTTLTIKWDDEPKLGAFTVTCMPAGIESQSTVITQSDTTVTLEGLLPNTQYTVSVSSPKNTSYFEKNSFWTNQAPPVTDYNVRGVTIVPRQLDRSSVRSLGIDSVINFTGNSDKCIELSEEKGYPLPDRKPSETAYDTYVSIGFFADKFDAPKQAEMTCILRLDGKISAGKTETVQLPEMGYKIILVNVTDLMDILYENTKVDGSDLIIDIYLNGQHMGAKTLPIEK